MPIINIQNLLRKLMAAIALTLLFQHSTAQSNLITEVFKLLPSGKLYGLTAGTRDSMLSGKTYYPADNDSNSIQAYNYGISDQVEDYMYVSMSYETEQRASGMIEIRSFPMKEGDLIIVSNTGGVWNANYQQIDLATYIYDKHKKLITYTKKLIPDNPESQFLKPGTPDSVRIIIHNNSNLTFNFSLEKPTLSLNSPYLLSNPISRKWLKADLIEFKWTGTQFVQSWIGFTTNL